jgi:hypothetical protein
MVTAKLFQYTEDIRYLCPKCKVTLGLVYPENMGPQLAHIYLGHCEDDKKYFELPLKEVEVRVSPEKVQPYIPDKPLEVPINA